ncbi:MAG: hypothetical protein II916_11475 [Oscillospiraceae bacterium]|nr:hypothetical protein [Oscillospiraceae bacterium]
MGERSTAHYDECRALLIRYRKRQRLRIILLAVCQLLGVWFHLYGLSVGDALLSVICSLVVLTLAFFADHEHLWLYIVLLVCLTFGLLVGIFEVPSIAALAGYLLAIPEYKKFQWIRKQFGYPHFSERLDEQTAHSDYEPMYPLEPETPLAAEVPSAEMPELEMPETDELSE